MAKHKKKKSHQKTTTEPLKASEATEFIETPQATDTAETMDSTAAGSDTSKKIHLEFYGSEALRQKAPQAFELAEAVAEEWVKDGNFQKLPISSPLAQLVAAVGLQSAKRVEKKLEEKGVITMAKMGFEFAKTKWPFKDQKNESI